MNFVSSSIKPKYGWLVMAWLNEPVLLETRPSVLIVYHADTNQKLANDVIVNCTRNRLMLIEY